jgi:hypothetical protein
MCWYNPIIPALGRQEDCELEAILGYIAISYLKKKKAHSLVTTERFGGKLQ